MFSKSKKNSSIDPDQKAQFEYAAKRVRQKKRLYQHFVVFLIGSVLLIVINKVLDVGQDFFIKDWFVWAILIWVFLLLYHVFNVFVTNKFMGKDWESSQLEKLKAKQQDRINKLEQSLGGPKESTATKLSPNLTMIVAAGENNEIGLNQELLWHLPDDFKRFKELTTGHHIIMGRKTWETFPKPLPNRIHIVISRDPDYKKPGCIVVNSLEAAIEKSAIDSQPYIIGGGQIYEQALEYAQKMEITRVHGTFEADAFFPAFDPANWKLIKEEFHGKDEKHTLSFTYQTFVRNH
ncbi:MAG: dihydrofolate reductase [Gilvibacter sp.]